MTLCRGCECEVVHTSRRFGPSKVRHSDIDFGARRLTVYDRRRSTMDEKLYNMTRSTRTEFRLECISTEAV